MENIYPCKTNQAPTYCHVTGAGAEPDTVGAVDVLRHVGEVGEHRHGGKMDQFHCRILNSISMNEILFNCFPLGTRVMVMGMEITMVSILQVLILIYVAGFS